MRTARTMILRASVDAEQLTRFHFRFRYQLVLDLRVFRVVGIRRTDCRYHLRSWHAIHHSETVKGLTVPGPPEVLFVINCAGRKTGQKH